MKIERYDMIVIGAGPAGLSAAIEAAKKGLKPIVFDENAKPGGQLFKQIHKFFGSKEHKAKVRGFKIGQELLAEAEEYGVEVVLNATVVGLYPEKEVTVKVGDKVKHYKGDAVLVATGASENMVNFEGWTKPGVIGAGAAQTMMNLHHIKPGNRILMLGSGNVGLVVSYQLMQAGCEVVPRSILMMMLNDKDTGEPLALMSANLLSAYRTGAIPGVGAKYLARKDSKVVTIVGPGVMGKTSLAAFISVCPKIDTVKIKGRGQRSIDSFVEYVKKEFPQIKTITVCETMEEAIRDSDIISTTTCVGDKEILFPYIDEKWIKEGALVCMPSAARFDESFYLDKNTKLVVDNYKLYEAWAEEYPYPSYDPVQIVGCKFMDLLHDKKITRDEIIDVADVITGKLAGRENDKQRIIYSVGGMPVEDIAWGETVYKRALELGIGVKLHLWDEPELH